MVNKKFISNDSTIAYGTQRRSKTIALNFRIFKRFHDYQKSYEAIEIRISQVEFQTLIRIFQNRCRKVIRARGGHTRY
jgi:hypothetical protein